MTAEPTESTPYTTVATDRDTAVLEDLFLLGYTTSEPIAIYKDEKTEIRVQYRTLLPYEHREIAQAVSSFTSPVAQYITEQIETLARAVVTINSMPLQLNLDDKKSFQSEHRREPTPLDQARYVMTKKIRSKHILDAMFDAYVEFVEGITKHFEELKKKLNQTRTFESTSP